MPKPTGSKHKRISGRARQTVRAFLLRRKPLCVECLKRGIARPALHRDHVVPLADGGSENDANTQGLCINCHKEKSAQEAAARAGEQRVKISVDGVPDGWESGEWDPVRDGPKRRPA